MMNFERMGVAKRWRSKSAVIARLRKNDPDDNSNREELEEIGLYNLRQERVEQEPVKGILKKGPVAVRNWRIIRYSPPRLCYSLYSGALKCQAVAGALERKRAWLDLLNKAASYGILTLNLGAFFQYQFHCMRLEEGSDRHLGGMIFVFSVEVMADLFVLGRVHDGVRWGRIIHSLITRQEFGYDLDPDYHRRAHFFMLRLFSQWNGLDREWPDYAHDEPLYEWLLEHWKEPDPEALVPALLAACDRHTHQSWDDTAKANHDFHNVTMYRYPAEILMLYRLRELEGLENPVLDHPLCEAPFDRLPEPQEPYDDNILRGTLKRVREDWPNYDAILEEAAAYPMRVPAYDMGRLHEFD